MAKAKKEATKELKWSLEEKLEKSIDDNSSLQKELKAMQNKVAKIEAMLRKKKKMLCSLEMLIKECMQNSDEALVQKVVLVEERTHQAIEEYKKSTFEDEIIEVGVAITRWNLLIIGIRFRSFILIRTFRASLWVKMMRKGLVSSRWQKNLRLPPPMK